MMSLSSVTSLSKKAEIDPQCICQSEHTNNGSVRFEHQENLYELKEEALRREYDDRMETEIKRLKEKFDLIIQNEEVRSSWLLREANRSRNEKISALKTQLECKNLATLMYLLCSERRKNQMETKLIVDEYTEHINTMTEIIVEGQKLMEELIRGYRTAEKVDDEWRSITQAVVCEFQKFLEHYFGSKPESSNFLFNLPELLKICAPLKPDDKVEETTSTITCGQGCACEEEPLSPEEETWWSNLSTAGKPFVVFGDMSDFSPTQRRKLLKDIKEDKKPPPDKWTQFAFNNSFLRATCPNVDLIKKKYLKSAPAEDHECPHAHSMRADYNRLAEAIRVEAAGGGATAWKGGSLDVGHGPLASIMRMVANATAFPRNMGNKASLLGAKDSLELISTTKLLERKEKNKDDRMSSMSEEIYPISLRSMGKKRASMAPDVESRCIPDFYRNDSEIGKPESFHMMKEDGEEMEDSTSEFSKLASIHQDSLQLVGSHSPTRSEADRIAREKECPVSACQRLHADDYLRNIPPYMDFRSPYWEYDRSFDNYERCTKEQLEKVLMRNPTLLERNGKNEKEEDIDENNDVGGQEFAAPPTDAAADVAMQTSDVSMCLCHILPPCATMFATSIDGDIASVRSKMIKDHVTPSQLFDDTIQFDRFEVLGENNEQATGELQHLQHDFAHERVDNIMKIMKKHPSVYSMFQANAKCF